MRTLIIIAGGLVLLLLFALVGSRMGGGAHAAATAAKIFIPVWLAAAAINMWIGVSRAGYSVAEEFPIFLLIFGVPAAIATFIAWKY